MNHAFYIFAELSEHTRAPCVGYTVGFSSILTHWPYRRWSQLTELDMGLG